MTLHEASSLRRPILFYIGSRARQKIVPVDDSCKTNYVVLRSMMCRLHMKQPVNVVAGEVRCSAVLYCVHGRCPFGSLFRRCCGCHLPAVSARNHATLRE